MSLSRSGEDHWICISTIGCEDGQVNILDSLYTGLPATATRQVAALLHSKLPSLKICYLDVAEQSGSNDCGCYAIAFAEALCRGEDPTTLDFNQSAMRSHLLSCFRNGVITPFAATHRASVGVKKTAELSTFRHNRQQESKV